MKSLLILAAMVFVSGSAMAWTPTASDSWDTIRTAYNRVEVDEPSVRLDVGALTTSAFFVCIDGPQLRTLKKFTRCLDWSDNDDDDSSRYCRNTQEYYGTAEIVSTRQRCIDWEEVSGSGDDTEMICVEYASYTYKQPLSFEVDVYSESGSDEDRGKKLFTKNLTIPHCE
jgi:hypothetical protein